MIRLEDLEGFIWDAGNREKSVRKHGVTAGEAEEAFFNPNLVYADEGHDATEERYRLLGITNDGRVLFIVFTVRDHTIRVISSRRANKKERTIYHETH